MADAILTAERLREVVEYDPATGIFTRRIRLAQRHQVGDRADFVSTGTQLKGYRRLAIDSKRYLAHRCAWLYMYGEWPERDVDHINGDRGDNRLANLRDVARRTNLENLRKPRSDNHTGYLGVIAHPGGRFRARIQHNGKGIHIGMYATPDEAHAAYVEAKRRMHEGCTI